ncbi:MAG: hypothetical protein MSJ26_06655 [Oscillospiraceae bacterium]|nr:hypothetical protein [Oscillospiraceae bacterium]
MADNNILNNNPELIADFELPPLPKRPVKLTESASPAAAEKQEEKTLEAVTESPSADSLKNANAEDIPDEVEEITAEDDFELPPLPEKTVDNSLDSVNENVSADSLENAVSEDVPDEVEEIEADEDFELPPLPEVKKEEKKPEDEPIIEKDEEPIDEITDSTFEFTDDYDLDNIDPSAVQLSALTSNIAPIRSGNEESARNMRESIKMNDLAMSVGSGPVLDDLSSEYKEPKNQAEDLLEKDKLDAEQKKILRQRLDADLGRRPENFNARASKNIANKLLEEKRLKISKKGFAISIIPIFMGLISTAICFFEMNWGNYNWFPYAAPFMLLASLLLLIKSKHVKLLSVSIYGIMALIYAGPGLVLFTLQNGIDGDMKHLLFGIAAVALNVISILILVKNEAVNTYYSSNIQKR